MKCFTALSQADSKAWLSDRTHTSEMNMLENVVICVDNDAAAGFGDSGRIDFQDIVQYAEAKGYHVIRKCFYTTFAPEKKRFFSALRYQGWKVSHATRGACHGRVEMTVDMLMTEHNAEVVILVGYEPELIHLIRALQLKGYRVEVLSAKPLGEEIRDAADYVVSLPLRPYMASRQESYANV